MAAKIPVVGIGASAGGLEALEALFSKMPANTGLAFVVIQHLSPHHKSAMGHLLGRSTELKVVELKQSIQVKPDCIYLNPPDKFVNLVDGRLEMSEPVSATSSIFLPIDHFFNTIAQDLQEKAICIVLSGTSSDGTMGLKAVKAAGGLTFAQSPGNAKYSGMPDSAIATRVVDFILPVDKIPQKLMEITSHAYIRRDAQFPAEEKNLDHSFNQVFSILHRKTRHDFSNYKINTVRRRVARRMAVHQVNNLSDYLMVLEKDPDEPQHLLKDMLIAVTSFFRDPEAFEILQEKAITTLVESKPLNDNIRVWVAGCSSGEEAYSIAILLAETMDRLNKHLNVQIFASDIDTDAIHTARMGVYPESIANDVTKSRIARYFIHTGDTLKIKKSIRDCIVFSIHNVIGDPPFSRIDLISCRNLLIYLKPELQKKILPLFHYALNAEGFLFLGLSETVGEYTSLFAAVSLKHKLFRHRVASAADYYSLHQIPLTTGRGTFTHLKDEKSKAPMPDVYSFIERIILDEYAPPGVLINRDLEILQFIGQTDRFLKTPKGRATFNIMTMAREGLSFKLNQVLMRAMKTNQQAQVEAVPVKHPKGVQHVDITVRPLPERPGGKELLIVLFEDHKPAVVRTGDATTKGKRTAKEPAVQLLKDELQATKEYLQTTIKELEASNEEFKATNEELQSVNEELQSANEELETSREELQSTNEELVTVNSEHQQKIEELTKSNSDINNLLESTEIASLFLDLNLCVRRFTPAVTKIINLRQTDSGRPITDITTRLIDTDITTYARQVIEKLDRRKLDVQDKEGRWYEIRILPYRTIENVIDGVAIAFIDITEIRQIASLRRVTTLFENSSDPVTIQDFNGRILAWNNRAEMLYGWTEEEALGMHINELTPEIHRLEYAAIISRLKRYERMEHFETQRLTKKGQCLNIRIFATILTDSNEKPVKFATFERVITRAKG